MRKLVLGLLILLAPARGAEAVRDLTVEVQEGPPASARFRGRADVADRVVLTLTLRHERTTPHGRKWTMLDRFKLRVQGGVIDKTFSLPGGLPFGLYKMELECDQDQQLPGVRLPPGGVHGEASFKVDFTEDFTAPARAYARSLATLQTLWTELDGTYKSLESRKKDPEAIEAWNRFQGPWTARMTETAAECPLVDDLLFPDLRAILYIVSGRISFWREEYESQIRSGKHCPSYDNEDKHWFKDPQFDLARCRSALAQELAFNAAKRVVDYGYGKATTLMGGPRWEAFRTRFGEDLGRMETACSDLSAGPNQAFFKEVAPDLPPLFRAAHALLDAGDTMAKDPAEGARALEAVKAPLKKAYLGIHQKIEAFQAGPVGVIPEDRK